MAYCITWWCCYLWIRSPIFRLYSESRFCNSLYMNLCPVLLSGQISSEASNFSFYFCHQKMSRFFCPPQSGAKPIFPVSLWPLSHPQPICLNVSRLTRVLELHHPICAWKTRLSQFSWLQFNFYFSQHASAMSGYCPMLLLLRMLIILKDQWRMVNYPIIHALQQIASLEHLCH